MNIPILREKNTSTALSDNSRTPHRGSARAAKSGVSKAKDTFLALRSSSFHDSEYLKCQQTAEF